MLLKTSVLLVCAAYIHYAAAGLHYIGCYKDAGARDLRFHQGDGVMSPKICLDKCLKKKFQYFGVQNGNQCFCGHSYGSHGKVPERDCYKRCHGHKAFICGATWRNSVYKTGYPQEKLPSQVRYLGCHLDKGPRDLRHHAGDGNMTPLTCYKRCTKKHYRYFGVQNGNQCFCGNFYGKFGKRPERQCHKKCDGNRAFICGATWRNSVYSTGTKIPMQKLPRGAKYKGCYLDKGTRDLRFHQGDGAMSPKKCFKKCHAKGFQYFGVQNGNQCFCGHAFGMYGRRPARECWKKCDGNRAYICGATWRNSVYSTGIPPYKLPHHSKYLGCYLDKGNRDLKHHAGDSSVMSPRECLKRCRSKKYQYFGVQNGNQCFCDHIYGAHGKQPERECHKRCTGNRRFICGATWRNSIYTTGIPQDFVPAKYLGCYLDKGPRDLRHHAGDGNMSPLTCYHRCKNKDYKYFGVQNGNQCFCDNWYGKFGVVSEKECSKKCDGNRAFICGNTWRNSIYKIGDFTLKPDKEKPKPKPKPEKPDKGGSGGGGGEFSSVCVDPYDGKHHEPGTSWISKDKSFCYHYKCGANAGNPLRTDCRDTHGSCVKASAGGRSFSCTYGKCDCLLKGGHTYVRHHTTSFS